MIEGGKVWFSVVALIVLGGCSGAVENGTAAPAAGQVGDSARHTAGVVDESIFTVRRPGSAVVAGTRVHVRGPGVRVTAVSARTVFIQEAGDSGACEVGDAVVAYRAIEVSSADALPPLVRGQRVEVSGVVADMDGHRSLIHAAVTPLDGPVVPYEAHCERDGRELSSPALDSVLVITAGTTENGSPPGDDGGWSLATCFAPTDAIGVGAEMVSYDSWEPTWHWVTGIMTGTAAGARLEPRDIHDIRAYGFDDACL
jgi:hypothetical protein